MRHFKSILLVALAISVFSACKKEGPEGPAGPAGPSGTSTDVNPAIYAKWEVISGATVSKYAILKSDHSFYLLDSATYGFKKLESDLAFVTQAQIRIFGTAYNYTISNDTLTLTSMYSNIVLKKNVNAPDETDWVTFITVTDTIDNPNAGGDGRQDIGFDGNDILWAGDWNSSNIYKINPATHATSGTLTLSGSYYAPQINYASSFIWISDNNTIDKVNPATGAVISTSPVLSAGILHSLALVGQKMYLSDGNGYVKTWDISTNAITPLLSSAYFNGMEYVNGFLYMLYEHQVYKCQLSPFEAVSTYYIDSPLVGGNMGGITHDGSSFWVVGYDDNTGEENLLKLSI